MIPFNCAISTLKDAVLTHALDPLNVCLHEDLCSKADSKSINCQECDIYLRAVKRHLSSDRDIERFITMLKVNFICYALKICK